MNRIDIYIEALIENIEEAKRILILQKIFNDFDTRKSK